jgi:glycosyltransferase-like protein LARGE
VNYLRNVALKQVVTPYVFLLDIDFLPMFNLYDYLKKAVSMIDMTSQKKVSIENLQ